MGYSKFTYKDTFNIGSYKSDLSIIELHRDSDEEINHERGLILEQLAGQYDLKLGEIEFYSPGHAKLNFDTFGYPYGGTYWISQLIYALGGMPFEEDDDTQISRLIAKKDGDYIEFEKERKKKA